MMIMYFIDSLHQSAIGIEFIVSHICDTCWATHQSERKMEEEEEE